MITDKEIAALIAARLIQGIEDMEKVGVLRHHLIAGFELALKEMKDGPRRQ